MFNWLNYYELFLGQVLKPEDYLFPNISVNGMIESHWPILSDTAQKMITKVAIAASLPRAALFTTHCFQCGGAQYHFMFAPDGE